MAGFGSQNYNWYIVVLCGVCILLGILIFSVVCVLGFVSNGIFNHSFEVARVTVKETISQIYNTTINLANTFRKLENTRGVDPDR